MATVQTQIGRGERHRQHERVGNRHRAVEAQRADRHDDGGKPGPDHDRKRPEAPAHARGRPADHHQRSAVLDVAHHDRGADRRFSAEQREEDPQLRTGEARRAALEEPEGDNREPGRDQAACASS